MDFTLSDDRQALVDVLGRFIRERYTLALRHKASQDAPGHDQATWQQLAEIGVIGALFDEEFGGFAGSPYDLIAIFETLGHGLVSEPVMPVLMAGTILEQARPDLLEDIIAGQSIVVPALFEAGGRYDHTIIQTRAVKTGSGFTLDGSKAVVAHAEAANALIVSATDESGSAGLYLVPTDSEGVFIRGYPGNDGTRAAEISLTNVALDDGARLGDIALADAAIAKGRLALCAEALGIAEWLKTATLDYLKTRVQFGKPIGSNQALQHRMVEMVVRIEQMRSAVINAAAAMDGNGGGTDTTARDRAISAAKYTVGNNGIEVAEESIQMHGGIGMTMELDMTHFARRAVLIDHQLGDADHHLASYIASAAAA